jgi:hypothetical protein
VDEPLLVKKFPLRALRRHWFVLITGSGQFQSRGFTTSKIRPLSTWISYNVLGYLRCFFQRYRVSKIIKPFYIALFDMLFSPFIKKVSSEFFIRDLVFQYVVANYKYFMFDGNKSLFYPFFPQGFGILPSNRCPSSLTPPMQIL